MSVLAGCKPRFEVMKGDLDDAIFAADFGDLVAGAAPKSLSGILCLRHTMSITEGDKYAEASQEDAES